MNTEESKQTEAALLTGQARCPRCGYDLRGVVAAWEDRCPLEGVCSECGLVVRWAEVLQPEKLEPQWCVEFAPRRRGLPAAVQTLVRSFWPWGFWRCLRMSHAVRRRRLARYVMLLLLVLLLGGVAAQVVVASRVRYEVEQDLLQEYRNCRRQLPMYQRKLQMLLTWQAVDPQKVLWARRDVQWVQRRASTAPVIHHSYREATIEAVVFPCAASSCGSVNWGGISPYPVAPRDLLSYCWYPPSGVPFSGFLTVHRSATILRGFAAGVWCSLFMPIGFILLPVSRRKARVRWCHVWRVACYGLALPWLMAMLLVLWVAVVYAIGDGRGWSFEPMQVAMLYLFAPAVVAWWATAIRRYLRIPHGWMIALLLGGTAWLGFVVVIC